MLLRNGLLFFWETLQLRRSGRLTCGNEHESDVVDQSEPALEQLPADPGGKVNKLINFKE